MGMGMGNTKQNTGLTMQKKPSIMYRVLYAQYYVYHDKSKGCRIKSIDIHTLYELYNICKKHNAISIHPVRPDEATVEVGNLPQYQYCSLPKADNNREKELEDKIIRLRKEIEDIKEVSESRESQLTKIYEITQMENE